MPNILILHSCDGPDWTHAILYPADWTQSKADRLAIEAFETAQRANPEEWNWDEYEPELVARGFMVANWHNGPTWDEQRVNVSRFPSVPWPGTAGGRVTNKGV